jgi:hypothetical protein
MHVTPPMAVIIPNTDGLDVTMTVDGRDFGRFGSSSHDFGAYFRSGVDAVLRVSSRYQTTLEYFAIPSRQQCAELWISTYQTETMDGSSEASGSNTTFRIGNNQDICFFHVSSVPTSISVDYSTEQRYDNLSWMYDDWQTSLTLTGIGSTSGTRSSCSGFYWHSDSSVVSSRVSIRWESGYSGLRQHRHWFSVTGNALALSDSVTPTRSAVRPTSDWVPNDGSDSFWLVVLLPIAAVTIVVAIFVSICCYCCSIRRRKSHELRGELSDIPPTEPIGPAFVDASSAVQAVPPRPNAPQYAACQVVGYPAPVGPYQPVAAPVGLAQGAGYQSPVPLPVAVPQGPVYQPPQFVQVAGGYAPVYFPVPGYPYNAGGVYQVPPPQQPQVLQQPRAGTDGPQ